MGGGGGGVARTPLATSKRVFDILIEPWTQWNHNAKKTSGKRA